jgi:hypothetical protein
MVWGRRRSAEEAVGQDVGRVLLHVGVPKTATTAVQTCLASMRPELASEGILYPGNGPAHVSVLRVPLGWEGISPTGKVAREWQAVAAEVRAHPGRAVVSGENAAVASPASARRIVDELGGDRVDVVVTLRPLEALLASHWQQDVKLGSSVGLTEWLDDVVRGPRPIHGDPHVFWYINDHPTVVANWMSAVGRERMHVVIVDPARPQAAFDAFASLLDLPSGWLDPRRSGRSNRSLSYPETEVVRRLNARLAETGEGDDAARRVRRAANYMIERRSPRDDEPKVRIPRLAIETIRGVSLDAVERLRALDVDVIGDLAALSPTSDIPDVVIPEVTDLPLDAAVLLLEGLVSNPAMVSASTDAAPQPT